MITTIAVQCPRCTMMHFALQPCPVCTAAEEFVGSRDQLAAAMRRMLNRPPADAEKITALAASFAGDCNGLYDTEPSKASLRGATGLCGASGVDGMWSSKTIGEPEA